VDKLFSSYYDFFKEKQLGRDVFLLLRIPNIWEEKGYRLARAFMSIVTAEDLTDDLGLHTPPIFEVVLPMVDDAEKLMYVHRSFGKIAEVEHSLFDSHPQHSRMINVIPLVENTLDLVRGGAILDDYLELYKAEYGRNPEYLRPFIARSDPALNAGYVPAVIGAKVAISEYYRFQDRTGIAVYPMIGAGSLPFRGGLSPDSIEPFLAEYGGIRTATIQSAFRYDFPLEDVKRAIAELNTRLPVTEPLMLTPAEVGEASKAIEPFMSEYRSTVEGVAQLINDFSGYVPERRERMLHIGLFGYSRAIGEKRLPRAIRFAAALYSLGIPPELIGTGRGIAEAERLGNMDLVERLCVNLKSHLRNAGRRLNRENLRSLCSRNSAWEAVQEDVRLIEDHLGEELGPDSDDDLIHRNLTSNIRVLYEAGREFGPDLERAARIRRSLG
jgi:phosphoenolpyruvate carboxylase